MLGGWNKRSRKNTANAEYITRNALRQRIRKEKETITIYKKQQQKESIIKKNNTILHSGY